MLHSPRTGLLAFLSLILLVVHLPSAYTSPLEFTAPDSNARNQSIAPGKYGAVASERDLCSRFGHDMLKKGGNAADALITTEFCLGVVSMHHSGIGGGGFMLVRSPNGTFEFINYREKAPAAAYQDMFQGNTKGAIYGGLASAVPGEVRALEYLHKNYGSLPWATLMAPAIRTARNGFHVTEDMVSYMNQAVAGGEDFLAKKPSWALDFAPNGTRVGLGDVMYRKRYANTLETISKHGADAFYSGPLAEHLINALRAENGTMTLKDMADYRVAIGNVSQIEYRGYKIASTTAPSSGTIALSILKILEGYKDLFSEKTVNISTHHLDEAIRFGYGERAKIGDPTFAKNVTKYEHEILDKATIASIHGKISDQHTQNVSAYDPEGLESLNTPGTSHIAAADHTGLAVTVTTTINLLYGSRVMIPETGVIMNCQMDDFSIPGSSNSFGFIPSSTNYIRPGKRPLSSISPLMVIRPNGKLLMLGGSAGGSRIITAAVQNVIRIVDQGMTAANALAQPRMHDQLEPNQVTFEWKYDNSTVAFMKSLGHNVTWVEPGKSCAQLVHVLPNGTFDAASEPRQVNSGAFAV